MVGVDAGAPGAAIPVGGGAGGQTALGSVVNVTTPPDTAARGGSGPIVTHRSRTSAEVVSSRARPIDLLGALADHGGAALVRHHGRTLVAADPREVVRGAAVWDAVDLPITPQTAPLRGHPLADAWIGLLAYDLSRTLETLPPARQFPGGPPEAALARYRAVAAHDEREGWMVIGPPRARAQLARALRAARPSPVPGAPGGAIATSLPGARYGAAVERARALIAAGDCYQVNLAQRLTASWDRGPLALAARLWHAAGTTSHRSYLALDEGHVISASPERLVAVRDGVAVSEPIKGTAARGAPWPEIATAKNRAEHVMIVDLVRNDLGRVARVGGVSVPALMRRAGTPYVDHMVSSIRAELRAGCTARALLAALFPGGSVTGAPKIRAMEVIDEIEPAPRGPAYGSVLSLARDGSLEASVAIRTAWLAEETAPLLVRRGGGLGFGSRRGAPRGVGEGRALPAGDRRRGMIRVWRDGAPADLPVGVPPDHPLVRWGEGLFETLRAGERTRPVRRRPS